MFEQARQKIEDMPGLNDEDTEEIKSKIDELENISKESISKKKKWEKVKPILSFAIDKSADVAISIMSLILQMKLGMYRRGLHMSYEYSENILVQESAGNLLRDELGWDVKFAYNTETLGKDGTFGRTSYNEILLFRYLKKH